MSQPALFETDLPETDLPEAPIHRDTLDSFGAFIEAHGITSDDPMWWWNWYDNPTIAPIAVTAYEVMQANRDTAAGLLPGGYMSYRNTAARAYTRACDAARDYGWDGSLLRRLPFYLGNLFRDQKWAAS